MPMEASISPPEGKKGGREGKRKGRREVGRKEGKGERKRNYRRLERCSVVKGIHLLLQRTCVGFPISLSGYSQSLITPDLWPQGALCSCSDTHIIKNNKNKYY